MIFTLNKRVYSAGAEALVFHATLIEIMGWVNVSRMRFEMCIEPRVEPGVITWSPALDRHGRGRFSIIDISLTNAQSYGGRQKFHEGVNDKCSAS